jgi:hypothetical protein
MPSGFRLAWDRAGLPGRAVLGATVLAALGVCTHCGGNAGPTETPRPKDEWTAAPPLPGHSIKNAKLCECTSCNPARCCGGDTEDEAAEASCGDSYDFSANGCALEVESCTSRCTKHVWRVPLTKSCDVQPRECCFSGPASNSQGSSG